MAYNTYIAVVDDDLSACTSLSRLLRLAHFEPVSYLSAETFLADRARPRFDCLVLDVRMDGMSGLELFKQIANNENHPPVIFISAVDEPGVRSEAQALGCVGFFSKSTPGADIIAAIRQATRDARPCDRKNDASASD